MIFMLKALFCFMFPWMVLLINDNPGGALIALIMQGSILGWPFASLWAWRTLFPKKEPNSSNPKSKSSKTMKEK